MSLCTIRNAQPEDADILFDFLHKLAVYEDMTELLDATPEKIRRTIFDQHMAEALIAEVAGQPVGCAIFFMTYGSFRAVRALYLEDLYVDENQRGKGYGKALLKHLAGIAIERGCGRMDWLVEDWNSPSIEFYKSLGAVPMEHSTVFRLQIDRIKALAVTQQ